MINVPMKFHDPRHIIGTNIVTKIHEDRKINVTSRLLTMFYYSNIWKNIPPPGSHVFLTNYIIETYILAKFYEDWNINVASTELTRQMLTAHDGHKATTKAHHEHVFNDSRPKHSNIIGTNIVTKIHEDRKINVTSRLLTMFYYSNIWKNIPPPGSHAFLTNYIIETYILAKFYEDWNINVASTELTRQMLTAHDGHKATTKAHHEHFHDDWRKHS
ncbi:hypothetical protein DPMN_001311 [Dreissena polymorpha]|uniref:Uncharacterized protein n=1 Tax=Dreissena polymorpha TaxID=45954 RepID=A0A9D4MK25_DREPO|nr:hypothetical protein DPMN_001311 [Dreissena polymorpha]